MDSTYYLREIKLGYSFIDTFLVKRKVREKDERSQKKTGILIGGDESSSFKM